MFLQSRSNFSSMYPYKNSGTPGVSQPIMIDALDAEKMAALKKINDFNDNAIRKAYSNQPSCAH